MNQRFTIDGSDALEQRLEALCASVCEQILTIVSPGFLHAVLLGGGYGRGEGGVLVTPDGETPYNDLEFYLITRGVDFLNQARFETALHRLSQTLSTSAGLDIEFKLLSLRKLQRSTVSMFYHDLISGHRLVHGTDWWLASCQHHRAAHRIPLHEATRLLMNRCAGLLFAQERLIRGDFTLVDADFTGRNLAKAKLAFGDVILTMRGEYHSSCRERHKRLRKLESAQRLPPSIFLLHEQGFNFKLHPFRSTRERNELIQELEFLKQVALDLWLDLESKRLNRKFCSVETYSFDLASKFPLAFKNCFINWRSFGITHAANPRYPRERLLNALPLLLWENSIEPRNLKFVQNQLRTSSDDFVGLIRAFEKLWRVYN